MHCKKDIKIRGFSLIELLVSVSIFAIVITMAVGALLVLIDANARAQNMQEVMTNLTFAIDSMTREIRTGRGLYCASSEPGSLPDEFDTRDCASGGAYLSIVEGGASISGTGQPRVSYRFNSTDSTIDRKIGDGNWFPVTAPNVNITEGVFYVEDSETALNGDDEQGNVTIYLEGFAGTISSVRSDFELQTTIVRRILDI